MKALHPHFFLAALSLAACSDDKEPAGDGGGEGAAGIEGSSSDHGEETDLGTVTLAGKEFGIIRLGDLAPGKESAFEVHAEGASADELARWSLYLWVEDEEGTRLSAPSKGAPEGSALHFHVLPRDPGSPPARVVLRLRADGTDERARLPLDGHGNDEDHGHDHDH